MNKNLNVIGFYLFMVFSLTTICNAEDELYKLQKNPFEKPEINHMQIERVDTQTKSTPTGDELNLRATIAAEKNSLANVDGKFISIDEEISGYRLVSVGEGTAVFVKQGIEVTLTVNEKYQKLK